MKIRLKLLHNFATDEGLRQCVDSSWEQPTFIISVSHKIFVRLSKCGGLKINVLAALA